MEFIKTLSKELQPKLVELRRDFHKYAELGWCEFRTASIVAKTLDGLGFKLLLGEDAMHIDENLAKCLPSEDILAAEMSRAESQGADKHYLNKMKGGKTGVVGILDTGKPGNVIALRFDMDALPIVEPSSPTHAPFAKEYASVNHGVMHACAHDGHTAIGLGVAMVLNEIKENLTGKIKLIFQPAEEGVPGAARAMIKAGVVDDVSHIIGFHLGLASESGTLFCESYDFKAFTGYRANFKGKAAHAGVNPEEGKSALLAAAAATMAMQGIYRHGKGASRINIGAFHSGTSSNIVPDAAALKLETRGETTEINEYMKKEVYRILNATASMYDVAVEIDEVGCAISGKCDENLVSLTRKTAQNLAIFDKIENTLPLNASEDFTYFMQHIQNAGGCASHFIIGANLAANHHNEFFEFDDGVLSNAVALLCGMAVSL